jgi:hypothetical protein
MIPIDPISAAAGQVSSSTASTSGDEMLTKRELAGRLKLTVRTVENWQRRGVVPYLKVSKIVLFHWPEVVQHLKANYSVRRRSRALVQAPAVGPA